MPRNGGDARGKARDRRKRKVWMLHMFGDGQTCECTHCGVELDFDSIQQDRIIAGGSYNRSNIQPSCALCNIRRSDTPMQVWRAKQHAHA